MNYLIDINIRWKLNGYGGENSNRIIGVCYDIYINVRKVEVKVSIFVVEACAQDLLLRHPWERLVRLTLTNKDDGLVIVEIKSSDGQRVVQFRAVNGEHERNRCYARLAKNDRNREKNPLNM